MKLFSGKVTIIAAEITRTLMDGGDLEVTDREEVEKDVEAVLKEYIRVERQIDEEAKDRLAKLNLAYSEFAKMKRTVAGQKGFGVGEDSITYIVGQLIECFMHSSHVEEVFSDDQTLNVKVRSILRGHMAVDEEVDKEVRGKIKHVESGTRDWEVEYEKVKEDVKRKLKLT